MIIAVDTGGTKTLVASFNESGAQVNRLKFPTPPTSNEYVSELVDVINQFADGHKLTAIAVGLPDITKGKTASYLVEHFAHLSWKNFDVVYELSAHFPKVRILAANDANLGALGEVRTMDNPPERVLYVTISTGIGTGVTINGTLDNDFARAEGGHLMLEFDGALRDWDSFGSGKAIYDTYGRYASDIDSKRIWRQISDRMSRGFFALIPIVRPDLIIIGGSVGSQFGKYKDDLVGRISEKLPPSLAMPRFVQAKHPEEAVIYGCYYYVVDNIAD